MDTTTLRVPDGTLEALDSEYADRGFDSRSEYLRAIVDRRDAIFEANTTANTDVNTPADTNTVGGEYDPDTLSTIEAAVLALCDQQGIDLARRRAEQSIAELATDWEAQGGANLALRQEVLLAAWERVRKAGRASRDDVEPLWNEYGADTRWQQFGSMWDWIAPKLSELPGVEHTPRSRYWTYADPIASDASVDVNQQEK